MGIVFKTLNWYNIRLNVHFTCALKNCCAFVIILNIFFLAIFDFWAFSVFWSDLYIYTIILCLHRMWRGATRDNRTNWNPL